MGHYRSEMGFDDEDEKRAQYKQRKLDNLTQCIQDDINEKGIARVLAEFIIHNEGNTRFLQYPLRSRDIS